MSRWHLQRRRRDIMKIGVHHRVRRADHEVAGMVREEGLLRKAGRGRRASSRCAQRRVAGGGGGATWRCFRAVGIAERRGIFLRLLSVARARAASRGAVAMLRALRARP